MKKQTALDWLAQQMQHPEIFNPYIEQAKEMEKQQITDAYRYGFTEGTCFGATTIYKFISAEQYYNETFNSEK